MFKSDRKQRIEKNLNRSYNNAYIMNQIIMNQGYSVLQFGYIVLVKNSVDV